MEILGRVRNDPTQASLAPIAPFAIWNWLSMTHAVVVRQVTRLRICRHINTFIEITQL